MGQPVADVQRGFQNPPDDARMMMRWWWFGPAVTKRGLEREMRAMKEGGIGGFEVQPVYPLQVEGNYPYLSDEFLDAVRFTGEKARELGLRFDLTLAAAGRTAARISDRPGVGAAAGCRKREPHARARGEKLIAHVSAARGWVDAVLHREPHAADGEAARGRRRRLVLDHYDRAALDHHLKLVGEPMLQGASARTRRTPSSATAWKSTAPTGPPNFLDEFRKRRGYDLTPYLPALAGDIGEKTAPSATIGARR